MYTEQDTPVHSITLRNEVGIAHLQVALAHQYNSTPLVCYKD